MRRRLLLPILFAGLLGSGVGTGALAGALPASASTPCANITLHASPSTVSPGQTETVSGSLTNCSGSAETITVRLHVSGPCDLSASRSYRIRLDAGQTVRGHKSFPAPNCAGTYRIRAAALVGGVVLDRAQTSFTVT